MADMNISLELNTETIEKIIQAASCVGQDIPTAKPIQGRRREAPNLRSRAR